MAPRPAWSVWLRRRWAFVWAWRLLLAPLVSDPKRDPALRAAALAERGETCATCRRSGGGPTRPPGGGGGIRFEVDHRWPLWASGKDELGNLQVLCSVCHVFKSRAEAPVRAMSKRWASRLDVFRRRPGPWMSVLGVIFLAGIITSRWWVAALLVLLALLFAARLIEWCLVPAPFRRRVRLGGLDGMTYWQKRDSEREQNMAGVVGANAKVLYGGRMKVIAAKLAAINVLIVYLAGVYVRHFSDDTALVLLRVLF